MTPGIYRYDWDVKLPWDDGPHGDPVARSKATSPRRARARGRTLGPKGSSENRGGNSGGLKGSMGNRRDIKMLKS